MKVDHLAARESVSVCGDQKQLKWLKLHSSCEKLLPVTRSEKKDISIVICQYCVYWQSVRYQMEDWFLSFHGNYYGKFGNWLVWLGLEENCY